MRRWPSRHTWAKLWRCSADSLATLQPYSGSSRRRPRLGWQALAWLAHEDKDFELIVLVLASAFFPGREDKSFELIVLVLASAPFRFTKTMILG